MRSDGSYVFLAGAHSVDAKKSGFVKSTTTVCFVQVTLETDEDLVTEMKVKYFDTVAPANAMCILKTGFLFVAAEFGNQ